MSSLVSAINGANPLQYDSISKAENPLKKADLLALQDLSKSKRAYKVDNAIIASEVTSVKEMGFSKALNQAIHSVDQIQKNSQSEIKDIMTGASNNIHRAMIASQEASVAFTVLVETRNKLMESYQELMRVQV